MSSYDSGIYQPVFSVIAKNANRGDLARFQEVIRTTLEETAKKGLDKKVLLAGINAMEFKAREADYGVYPKGLMYGIDLFDSWLYDEGMPFDYLKFDVFAKLRAKVVEDYYEELIRTYLLGNPHTSYVIVEPERGLTARMEEAVAAKTESVPRIADIRADFGACRKNCKTAPLSGDAFFAGGACKNTDALQRGHREKSRCLFKYRI